MESSSVVTAVGGSISESGGASAGVIATGSDAEVGDYEAEATGSGNSDKAGEYCGSYLATVAYEAYESVMGVAEGNAVCGGSISASGADDADVDAVSGYVAGYSVGVASGVTTDDDESEAVYCSASEVSDGVFNEVTYAAGWHDG